MYLLNNSYQAIGSFNLKTMSEISGTKKVAINCFATMEINLQMLVLQQVFMVPLLVLVWVLRLVI